MPVEFCSPLSVVVGDKLYKEGCVFRKKNDVSKSENPPVILTSEVIVAGKGAWS
jgi:hypothetical protein